MRHIGRLLPFVFLVLSTSLLAQQAPPGLAVTTRTFAFSYFADVQGNVGFVFVERLFDPTSGSTITNLDYSFCVQTTASSCLEGTGSIPNNEFTGDVTATSKMDVLMLQADTNIAGFDNHLCTAPNAIGGCSQGTSPATGGIISISFTKTRSYSETFTSSDLQRRNGTVVLNTTNTTYQASGSTVGTVIGTNVNNLQSLLSFDTTTSGKASTQSNALEKWLTGKSLGPQTLRRLQMLTGKSSW
jgi:hypothetical protein